FLLGEVSQRGWWHYYIVALWLKTPVALLLLLAFALFTTEQNGIDRLQRMLLIPILLCPLYFSVFRVSRGIRYILPIYPLLFVWVSRITAVDLRGFGARLRPLLPIGLLWYAAGTVWIAPHYMAYFNEIGGGPSNGHNLLYESDFDWGQEL